MAKILLVDFGAADKDRLISGKYDVDLLTTGWTTGRNEPLDIPGDSEIVFFQIASEAAGAGPGLQAEAREALAERVRAGARIVCFVGCGDTARLTALAGSVDGLEIKEAARADAVVFNPRALFHVPFERFKPYMAKTYRLLPETFGEGVWEKSSPVNGTIEILAKTVDGSPVAMVVAKGEGHLMLLPSFGPKNVEVVEYLLKDKLRLASQPPADTEADWIEGDDYAFPELKTLMAKREEEKKKLEEVLADYDRRIKEMKAGELGTFHRLLDGEGESLRKAVVNALRYLGWGRVVDVDQYWKNTIRNREEDIWVIEPADAPVETGLRKGELVLVLVRGDRNWATDDDCALLQKFKGRRMQEFDNTRMKALLVGNYHSATEAKARPNPFAAAQVEEAQKDGNGLLTTYELFRAIKAEKDGRVSKDAIRDQIKLKTGLITFDI